jgi:oligopeptide/dipeptide ABC transporter ATP-binding protein
MLRLQATVEGSVRLRSKELTSLSKRHLREARSMIQIVFQDPLGSVDPRRTVAHIVEEPLRIHSRLSSAQRRARVRELLDQVGLRSELLRSKPHELSGGQLQRVSIARALTMEPELLVLDEPVSALDVSVQAQVIALLKRLQREVGLAYLFIAHDLAVVRHVADEVAVMYLGRIVEIAPAADLYTNPSHPYTLALLSAAPIPDASLERSREKIILVGETPDPAHRPSGCHFHTRCWLKKKLGDPSECSTRVPILLPSGNHALTACHFSSEISGVR